MKKMIRRIIPEEDVPEYFNKLHNISGKVASKFYNDMETPVQRDNSSYHFFHKNSSKSIVLIGSILSNIKY
jgi:hypothetical protein